MQARPNLTAWLMVSPLAIVAGRGSLSLPVSSTDRLSLGFLDGDRVSHHPRLFMEN